MRIANILVEATNRFSAGEKRLINIALSHIPTNQPITEDDVFWVTARELVALGCNVKGVYSEMKRLARGLRRRDLTIPVNLIYPEITSEKTDLTIGYARLVASDPEKQSVGLAFDKILIPHISPLKEQFTFHQLEDVAGFRSRYTDPLYKLQMRWTHVKDGNGALKTKAVWNANIDDLRRILGVPAAYDLTRLRSRVIDIALNEINATEAATKIRSTYDLDYDTKIGKT